MRVSILTLGSRGDVEPYLALAIGLQASGYSVQLASHSIFESWIRSYGIDFALVRFNPKDIVGHPDVRRAKSNIVRFMLTVRTLLTEQYFNIFDDFWEACQNSDAIIASPTASNAGECAQVLELPFIAAMVQPLIPTREFPSFFLPVMPNLGGAVNLASHHLFIQLMWQNVRASINRWRQERLGIKSAPLFGSCRWMHRERVPQLVACTSALISKPRDWRDWHHLTGYWFLEQPSDFQPPSEVEAFLDSGPSPVYIGFGSMNDEQPDRLAEVAVEALERSNQRGVLAIGWGGLQPHALPNNILQLDEISHRWLFPHMGAIIHHGGAGTTASALYSGVPSAVVPFGGDQHHWGRLLVDRGLSPGTLPVNKINAGTLATVISALVNDQDLRERASLIGASVREEQGVTRAVEIIDDYLRS